MVRVLQHVVVCSSVLQRADRCLLGVLQCIAVCYSMSHGADECFVNVLQCVAVYCSVLQRADTCRVGVLRCVAVCCSVLQCVVVDTFSHTQLLVSPTLGGAYKDSTCRFLQPTATHCNTMNHSKRCIQSYYESILATHCNTL